MIYAIGDIHGQYSKLHALMVRIEPKLTDKDRLLFIGDYVDRGPSSCQVIEYLIRLKEKRPNTIFLRGNHDQAMLDARDIDDPQRETDLTPEDVLWWWNCGARETLASYPDIKPWRTAVPESHWKFLESTEMEYEEGNYLFVHAGVVPPGVKWNEFGDPRLWIRDAFIKSDADFGKIVVFGHTPQDLFFPIVLENKVGIDTGAAYGGPLTAFVVSPKAKYEPKHAYFIYSADR
jgi:serine/threonine protein phosphatase 1